MQQKGRASTHDIVISFMPLFFQCHHMNKNKGANQSTTNTHKVICVHIVSSKKNSLGKVRMLIIPFILRYIIEGLISNCSATKNIILSRARLP